MSATAIHDTTVQMSSFNSLPSVGIPNGQLQNWEVTDLHQQIDALKGQLDKRFKQILTVTVAVSLVAISIIITGVAIQSFSLPFAGLCLFGFATLNTVLRCEKTLNPKAEIALNDESYYQFMKERNLSLNLETLIRTYDCYFQDKLISQCLIRIHDCYIQHKVIFQYPIDVISDHTIEKFRGDSEFITFAKQHGLSLHNDSVQVNYAMFQRKQQLDLKIEAIRNNSTPQEDNGLVIGNDDD